MCSCIAGMRVPFTTHRSAMLCGALTMLSCAPSLQSVTIIVQFFLLNLTQ